MDNTNDKNAINKQDEESIWFDIYNPRDRKKGVATVIGFFAGWFFFYIGDIIPNEFGIENISTTAEIYVTMLVLGVTFGYYLSKAMEDSSPSFLFISSFFAYIVVILVTGKVERVSATLLSSSIILTLGMYYSIVKDKDILHQGFKIFGEKLSWVYLVGRTYLIYELPILQAIWEQGVSFWNIVKMLVLTLATLLGFAIVYQFIKYLRENSNLK